MKMVKTATVAALFVALLAGCQSVPPAAPVPQEVLEPQKAPGPHEGNPVISVSVTPKEKAAASLADRLKKDVEGYALRNGFTVSLVWRPDVKVEVAVSRREKAALQDWRAYEGEAHVTAVAAADGTVIDTAVIKASGNRGNDERSAEESLFTDLSAKVRNWMGRTVHADRVVKLPAFGE